MKTEYRAIFTATFETSAERDKVVAWLKSKASTVAAAATIKRADVTADEYPIPDNTTTSEKII